jgi:hypothetical protein
VDWQLTFAAATYNLVRMRNLEATRSHRGYAHRHRSLPALILTEPPLTRVLQQPAREGGGGTSPAGFGLQASGALGVAAQPLLGPDQLLWVVPDRSGLPGVWCGVWSTVSQRNWNDLVKQGIGNDAMTLFVWMPDIQAEIPERLVARLECIEQVDEGYSIGIKLLTDIPV